jgi:signal transduction histidine kinase
VLRDEAGRPARLLGANYDVTQRRRTEEALRRMNETLEERVEDRTRQVRELSRSLALAEQEERRRIAHVLHDGLQQSLFGAQIAAAAGDTDRVEAILDEAMDVARSLSHSLSPPFLEGEDVEDLLRWMAERHQLRYGMEVEVEAGGDVPVPDPALRVLLYQIVRELLFNVAKHAGTDRVRIVARRTDGRIRVEVEDTGVGFDPRDLGHSTGLGLRSVREWADLIGGRLSIDSAPGAGTRVALTLPADGAE